MDISEFSYVWTAQKRDFVLVKSEYGYAIVNKRDQTMLCISDDETDAAVVEKMLEEGCSVYEDILDAYSDV
jgi:hypothetical protein